VRKIEPGHVSPRAISRGQAVTLPPDPMRTSDSAQFRALNYMSYTNNLARRAYSPRKPTCLLLARRTQARR
jgi:hypothetical protein